MRAADPFQEYEAPERKPGQFARHAKSGAPIVAHPTKTTKIDGDKAALIALCAQRSITLPDKVTVPQLHALLGGRPQRVTYGRPSSLGKQIENMTNIQKWSERAVALGLFLDASMMDDLAALTDEQCNLDDAQARELLDKIAVKAKSRAQAGLAADRGTHHHELTEDHDLDRDPVERMAAGEQLGVPLPVQAALVAAWAKMLTDFDIEILATEATCVDDVWRQAGTLDRICRLRRDLAFVTVNGEMVTLPAGWVGILDIKTGKLRTDRSGFVSYWHGYSVQLSSYAQSVMYDPDTDQRSEWPWPIDQQWAVIAHLDVLAALDGEAVCRLVLVDLAAGRHAGALCVAAREWESRTDVFSIPTDELAVRVNVSDAIAAAGSEDLAAAPEVVPVAPAPAPEPPRAVPDATTDLDVDIATGTTTIDPVSPAGSKTAGAAIPVAAPAALSPLRQAQADRKRIDATAEFRRRLATTTPEEGDMSDDTTFTAVHAAYNRLDNTGKAWIKALSAEAETVKRGFSARHCKSVRRFETLSGLVRCAADELGDDEVRGMLALIDRRIDQYGSVPLGHIVGSLTATEAAQFAGLAHGRLAPTFTANGSHVLAEVAA